MENMRDKVIKGTLWRIGEKVGAQTVGFITSVVLARILDPSHYGEISLVIVFINILQVFVDSGFGNALIQKKESDQLDFSSVFFFNIFICSVLYMLLFLASPLFALFYNIPSLTNVLRVLGLILILAAPKNVIQAYISKKMEFKKFFYATLFGTVLSGIIAIIFAYKGAGVWALVIQNITNTLIDTVFLWIFVKWRPSICFSIFRLKKLFKFGWKILVRDIIDTTYNNLNALFIGKFYTTADLAYYDNGDKIPSSIYRNVDSAIRSVVFPVFSYEQEDKELIKRHMLKIINICSYISLPLLLGIASCSEQIVTLVWTEKWLPCVPFLRISCIIWSLNSIQALNQQVILALGRSDLCLRNESVIKIISLVLMLIALRFGVMEMAIARLVTSFIALFINLAPNVRLLNCKMLEQLKYCYKEAVLAIIMSFLVYFIGNIGINIYFKLIIQVFSGIIIYVLGSFMLGLEGYYFFVEFMKRIIKRR